MTLSPLGVRVSPFVSGLSLLHVSPRFCTSPESSILMIESTVSRGADVTSSACPAMSTWQLGAKHSITKRSTRRAPREVRLALMAHPRRAQGPRIVLSSLVARGLAGHFAKGEPVARSWLKTYECECTNPSAAGRTSGAVPTAPARPRTGPRAAAARRRGLGRTSPGRTALGLAQQHPAGGGDRGETEGRGGGPADGRPVHDQHDRHEHTAESRPADHVAALTRTRGAERARRARRAPPAVAARGAVRAAGPGRGRERGRRQGRTVVRTRKLPGGGGVTEVPTTGAAVRSP